MRTGEVMVDEREAEVEALKEAMSLFTTTAQSLERTHDALRARAADLTREVSSLRDRLEKVLAAISDGVVACDLQRRATIVNAAAARLGIKEGLDLAASNAPVAAVVLPLLEKALGGGRVHLKETAFDGPGGETLVLSVSADPLQDEKDAIEGAVATFRDITEVRRLQADLERKERLALLGQMAASIAHEVRNPLGGIRIYLALAQRARERDKQEDVASALDEIEKGVAGIDRIVEDILTFARDMKPRKQSIALRALVEAAAASLDEQRPDGLEVDNRVPDECVVLGDAGLVERALANILDNAFHAAGEGGHVRVETYESPGHVEISITDDGPGLAYEAEGRAFEPFFTSRAEGTGLGLAIVQRIAEAHGGAALIHNVSPHGVRVLLILKKGESACPA